jgi:glycosyltransferase involved in cell wall biosynthesis
MNDTLIIIPAYNEEHSIGAVLAELDDVMPDLDVVVISDGSTDATVDVVATTNAALLELPYNIGIGGALRTGFAYAVRNGYKRAVQFDADGQHDPLQVRPLLARLDEGADLVVGSRFADGGAVTYAVGRIRRVAMRLLSKLVQLLVGRRFTDTSSGFRAFSRPLLEYFAKTYPVEYMDSVEALVLASNTGFEIAEVGVNMRGRTGGAPSTRRVKLVYYYVRLVIVLLASATGERRRASRHSDRHPAPAKGARA